MINSTGNVGFTFTFPINLIVYSGGTLQDRIDNNRIYTRPDSVFTIMPNASFIGNDTEVIVANGSTTARAINGSIKFGSRVKGPLTVGVLVDGTAKKFKSVMCLARRSGSFSTSSTWLGGVAPTVNFCALAGGCGLYLSSGFTLSTESLNGELNIQFNTITILSGSTFQLGASGLTSGFRFRYVTTINCYGIIQDVTSGTGGIYFPLSSSFNLFTGSRFVSVVPTFLRIYNTTTGSTIGTSLSLSASLSGPFYVAVSSNGEISTSTTSKASSHFSFLYSIVCFFLSF